MKISWIRTKDDKNSFRIFENLGFNVINIEEPENTKYKNKDDISIIIASGNNNEKD